MPHNLIGRSSVTLETMGGLVTIAKPQDLPEGASPRNSDVDFTIGGMGQRPGTVTGLVYGGESVGPNGGGAAADIVTGGVQWTNPTNVLLNDGSFATVSVPTSGFQIFTAATGSNGGGSNTPWTNPGNVGAADPNFATVTLTIPQNPPPSPPSPPQPPIGPPFPPPNPPGPGPIREPILDPIDSQALNAGNFNFTIPNGANILGIQLNFNAFATGTGIPSIQVQLMQNTVPVGDVVTVNLPATETSITLGSNTNLWDANWTPSLINGGYFGVQITAVCTGNFPAANSFSINNLTATITFKSATFSDPLQVTEFGFALSPTSGITGIEVNLKGFAPAGASLTVQLLQGGLLVGSTRTAILPLSNSTVTVGSSSDLWNTSWTASNINNTQFGVRISAQGTVLQSLDFVSVTVFQTPSLANFLYAKTFLQPSGQVNSLALDKNGLLWAENVNTNPGILNEILETIQPGAYMFSSTDSNREYMCFSDLTVGSDIPRQWAGPGDTNFDRISQVAPGAPPSFNSSLTSNSIASITSWSITSNVVTFQATNSFTVGEIVTIQGLSTGNFMNGVTFTILGTGLSGSQFEVAFNHANTSATESGQAVPQYTYPITSIIQNGANTIPLDIMLWSNGPGGVQQGNVCTVYYKPATTFPTPDPILVQAFQSGNPVYVYMSGCAFGNGTQLVTSIGKGIPPSVSNPRWYFTFNMPTANAQATRSNQTPGSYQLSIATVTTTSPVPNLLVGDQVQITGSSPSGWNSTWQIVTALNGGTFSVTQTSMTGGTATYTWSLISGSAPVAGQLVTITGTLNGNGIFNVTDAAIASASGTNSGTFTVNGFSSNTIPAAAENGTAQSSGTTFQIDPGVKTLGNPSQSPIFGNAASGNIVVVGGNASSFPIAAGTRQGVCLFLTRNGSITPASVPITFTTGTQSNYIFANNIPIGPPDVIARIIALTEAGQNGIPGAYFYYIPVPVTSTLNNAQITYSSTVVQDNVSTSAKFTFDDATLLNATEIDVPGLDYFNTVELGNAAWNIPYAGRVFYGGVQNKVYNFNNLSFDGGFLFNPFGTALTPLGWTVDTTSNPAAGNPALITAFSITSNVVTLFATNNFKSGQQVGISGLGVATYLNDQTFTVLSTGLSTSQFEVAFTHSNVSLTADSGDAFPLNVSGTLLNSPIFGNSYYIQNTTAATQSVLGMITQTAYQDAYGVNILNPQVKYGVRVTARCPSGIQTGNLIVDLTSNNTILYQAGGFVVNFGITYQAFVTPLSTMTTNFITFQGELLSTPFTSQVPTTLTLRLWAQNLPYFGDVEVDRIEIYPLEQPIGFPQDAVGVIGSYVNRPEAFDINTGVIPLSLGNQQQVFGAAILYDQLYFLKEESIYSTQDTPGQEPGNWVVHQVTDKVGACGIYAYDVGKEYLVTACRAGVFAFNGGEPGSLNWEIRDLWNSINWSAGRSIWVKNDIVNHRLYVGVPLPTPNQWLPNAPSNPNPTSPNVVLMCNYLGLETFNDLVGGSGMHVTMFGTLADLDMRRKWTIWQIPSPNGAFLSRADLLDKPIFFCNGISSGKLYSLSSTQTTDDGVPINWEYFTYGFTNSAKSKENPLLGFHRKRYTKLQVTGEGSAALNIELFPDDPTNVAGMWNVWNPPVLTSQTLDYVRNLNVAGNRVFLRFSQDDIEASSSISRVILVGNMDLHAPMPNIPGR